jgi:deoxyadenosine/deoxycytidine kinase
MPSQNIPVLVITGPVGVGKTTVATALSELLCQADLAHAVIDLDWLRWCYLSPAEIPSSLRWGYETWPLSGHTTRLPGQRA